MASALCCVFQRAPDVAASLGSSLPMALDVGKSLSAASLSQQAKRCGRWDCTDRQTDCLELANGVHRLLDAEGAKPSLRGAASLAASGHGGLAAGVAQRGLRCGKETSSAPRLPRVPANCSEGRPAAHGAGSSSDPSRHPGGRLFLEEQQMKASASHLQSSAEESSAAGVHRNIASSCWSQRPQTPSSSLLESLPQQTPLSPKSPLQSRSRSSFSAISFEEHSASEQQEGQCSRSSLASPDTPSAAAWDLCRRPAATEGRALRDRTPLGIPMERLRKMSSYQADYWACAIPDTLPPSPDRQSPHWDPNKEYKDLLDYAYPLKPRYKLGKTPEPLFHDSGIDLDSFSLSPEGTLRSASIYSQGWQAQGSRESRHQGAVAPARKHSTPVAGKASCAGATSWCEPSPIAKASFAKSASSAGTAGPSRGFAKDLMAELARLSSSNRPDVDGRSWGARGSPFSSHRGKALESANGFLPTTRVLPLRKEWDGDGEFLSLPPRLRELERLSQVLSDLSVTIRTPRESCLPPPSDSQEPLSAEWAPFGEANRRGQRERTEGSGPCHPYGSWKPAWDSARSCSHIDADPLHLPASTRGTLQGTYLNPSELNAKGHPRERGQRGGSLAHCIKVFCCQLEELICWLHKVADIADSWVPPAPDAASVRAALHRYVEFRRDVADHRSLTESVLQRGEVLLECMAANSPALKDTLGLIARQSEELENRAERLYQSLLAAVDPAQGEDSSSAQQAQEAQWVQPLAELGSVSHSQDG